jgi:hypothetical protein
MELNAEDISEEQKKANYQKSIKKEPTLDLNIKEQSLLVYGSNMKKVTIKFYIIDVEILFSRTPFLKENTDEFSYVKPYHVIEKGSDVIDNFEQLLNSP